MAAIFDMDGLLLDTEPLWGESMLKIAQAHQVPIDKHFFKHTTGLRITEVTAFWKERYPWPGKASSEQLAEEVLDDIIALSKSKGSIMPGVVDSLNWLQSQGIPIGLATSSPTRMMNDLVNHFGLTIYFQVMTSADTAHYGKPHPEVYLQCTNQLNIRPWHCIALEDSVNGIIAAKAARMKAIAVPDAAHFHDDRYGIADAKLSSLKEFNADLWQRLSQV